MVKVTKISLSDPRIQAALFDFARTECLPPNYVLTNAHDSLHDVYVARPWFVTRGDWSATGKTRTEAIAAAWEHSDLHDGPFIIEE